MHHLDGRGTSAYAWMCRKLPADKAGPAAPVGPFLSSKMAPSFRTQKQHASCKQNNNASKGLQELSKLAKARRGLSLSSKDAAKGESIGLCYSRFQLDCGSFSGGRKIFFGSPFLQIFAFFVLGSSATRVVGCSG